MPRGASHGRGPPGDNARMCTTGSWRAWPALLLVLLAPPLHAAPLEALASDDPGARAEAFEQITQQGPDAAAAVVALLDHADPALRALAPRLAAALARATPAADHPALASRLLDALARRSVPPLPAFAPPPAGPGIAGLLDMARAHAEFSGELAAALAERNRHDDQVGGVLAVGAALADASHAPAFAALLEDAALAHAALDALARLPGAADALRAALAHPDAALQIRAGAALAERGEAVPEPVDPASARGVALALREAQALAAGGDLSAAQARLSRALDHAVSWPQVRGALTLLSQVAPGEAGRRALGYAATPEVRDIVVAALAADSSGEADSRIAAAYERATPAARATLLAALAARGSSRFPALATAARGAEDPALRLAAIALLGGAPQDDDLLAAANTRAGDDGALRALLDRAHALALAGEREAAADRFRAVLATPTVDAMRAEALEGLGACGDPRDLPTLEAAMDHGGLRAAAHRARAAFWAAQPDSPEARETLAGIAIGAPGDDAAGLAYDALAWRGAADPELAARRGWVVAWSVLGPIPAPTVDTLDTVHFEEARGEAAASVSHGDVEYSWAPAATGGIPAVAALPSDTSLAEGSVGVWYASARIPSSGWASAHLHLGADRPFRALLNGDEIARVDAVAAFSPNLHRAAVRLRPGVNRLVLKMAGPGPRFSARFSTRRGAPIDLAGQHMPDDGLAGTGIAAPALLDDRLP